MQDGTGVLHWALHKLNNESNTAQRRNLGEFIQHVLEVSPAAAHMQTVVRARSEATKLRVYTQ